MIAISHSDIQQFLRCRRQWYWHFVDDYQAPEVPHGPLALGSRVHLAVEEHYRGDPDPVAVHDGLVRTDVEHFTGRITDWEMDQLYEDAVVGRNCVRAFLEWLDETRADDPFEVVDVEQTLQKEILEGRVLLRGKADTILADTVGGGYVVQDIKTSGMWRSGQREMLERSFQHHVYMALADETYGTERAPSRAMYTILRKVKNPKRATQPMVERFRVPGTLRSAMFRMRQIETICAEMLRTIDLAAEQGREVVTWPSPADSCRWCEFKAPCEIMDETPDAAWDMLEREYEQGRKHKRYADTES